jgi:hypothetical protein
MEANMRRRPGYPWPARTGIAVIAFAWGVASAATSPAPLAFADVTSVAGITYAGPSWSVAWADADKDALPDLFVGNHGAPHNLFLNRGTGRLAEIESWRLERAASDAHGLAWADFDNDGDQDLLELVGAQRGTATKANHLFVNEDGVFRDRAIERGIDDRYGRGRRPIWFDWDLDGRLDVLLLNEVRADGPSALYRNRGGYFSKTDVLAPVGHTRFPLLGSFARNRTHVLISGWWFPDRIHDANQLSPLPLPDLRAALGVPQAPSVTDTALLDFNGDGIDDLLETTGDLASDAVINKGRILSRLKLDDLGGTRGFDFTATGTLEVLIAPRADIWWHPGVVYIGSSGVHPVGIPFKLSLSDPSVYGLSTPQGERGVYVGYDRPTGTWRLRLVGTSYQEANFRITATSLADLKTVGFERFVPRSKPVLFLSTSEGFYDASVAAGLVDPAMTSNCFSMVAADFDNDMDVDAVAACSGPLGLPGVSNQLLRNDGSGRFTLVAQAGGVRRAETGVADGIAAADFDLDGFLDLTLTNGQGIPPFNVGRTQVFRNASGQAGNRNHWLQVDLRGVSSNRDGVGARLVMNAGGKTQRRMQRNGVHSGGQDHQRIHFGLGSATTVQSLEVIWPGGTRQVEYGLPVDQVVRIVEGRPWAQPFTVKPSAQSFGDVLVSSSVTRSFTLTNPGTAALPVVKIRSVGSQAGQFAVAHACGASLQVGASCLVNVTFRPTRTGTSTAKLMVVAGDQFVQLANLSGRGT